MSITTTGEANEQARTRDKLAIVKAARILGDTWALLIVADLLSWRKRFGELQEALQNVSPQTLSNRLKALETVGVITRQAYAEIPPRVEYTLTEVGQAMAGIIDALEAFGAKHLAEEDCHPDAKVEDCDTEA